MALGPLNLKNRVVMGPMTRARADDDGCPNALMKQYYAQRASCGLILSEGVYPSIEGKGYFATPGIETDAHVLAWKKVTDAVHDADGFIYMQLMHCGRVGHPHNNGGVQSVAPSAVQANFQILTRQEGMVQMARPHALDAGEVNQLLQRIERAAANAKAAGFDGIELHAASGYLANQFLASNTNLRDDKWGGTPQKRVRFVVEAMERLYAVFGQDRTGIKIAPGIAYNDIDDATVEETYGYLLSHLEAARPAYVHFQTTLSYANLTGVGSVASSEGRNEVWRHWPYEFVRNHFSGTVIAAGDLTHALAQDILDAGMADLFVFGRPYISNPDLPERMKVNAPLNEPDRMTFYGGGADGFTNYPAMTD